MPRLVSIILKKNPSLVNAPNSSGETPLHKAAFSGNVDVARLLIKTYKAEVNKQNKRGDTPLHFGARRGTHYRIFAADSCFSGYIEVVKLLLENGADPRIMGEHGTAHTVAEMFDHFEIASVLSSMTPQIKKLVYLSVYSC